MVDNVRFNRILPSLTPSHRVARTDSKGRNNRQTPFKDSLKHKRKKKEKDESDIDVDPANQKSNGTGMQPTSGRVDKSPRSRLIDIRV